MNKEIILQFREILKTTGYFSYYQAFGSGNKRFNGWHKFQDRIQEPASKLLLKLFLLEEAISEQAIQAVLGSEVLELLQSNQIITIEAGHVKTNNLVLLSYHGIWFFCQNGLNPDVYFGTDSIALATYQHPLMGGRSLDLCAGSGIQAMIASLYNKEAYAVEINPIAADIAKFNVHLNGLEEKVNVFNASLEDFINEDHGEFDLITFNPPLLPIPEPLFYPFVGDGGKDGLALTKKILELYFNRLSPNGVFEFIGCGLGKDGHTYFTDDIEDIAAKFGATGYTLLTGKGQMKPGEPAFDSTVVTTAAASGISSDLASSTFQIHMEQMDANEMYCFFVRLEKKRPEQLESMPSFRHLDLTHKIFHWYLIDTPQ